jgi:4-cresol dehydrogenase (hydroxylating) flavoprotein subunit
MANKDVSAWRDAVGSEHVEVRSDQLDASARATFATQATPQAIVRPANLREVQACVRLANELGTAIYPISGGKNWGFGSAVATVDGAVLLDLSRMNRIVAFDEEMAYISVEPGVTFRQVYEFLRARGGKLFSSVIGGSPEASLVGNALERGDGTGRYGDRSRFVCGMEVVLPTGEHVATGFNRFDGASTAALLPSAPGPGMEGLFLQSNLGVVTQMTFWLQPIPAVLQVVRFSLRDNVALSKAVDAIRALRLEGSMDSLVSIWNDYRVLSTRGQYPWDRMGDRTPITRAQLAMLDPSRTISAWYGATALYLPSRSMANATQERFTELLGPLVEEMSFIERDRDGATRKVLLSNHGARTNSLAPIGNDAVLLDAYLGAPQVMSQASMYWRKRSPLPQLFDPNRDGCGVLWSSFALPLRGADWLDMSPLVESIFFEHGFEPMLVYLVHHDRAAYLLPMLVYDRDLPGEDERARACHDAVTSALRARGHLPFRLGLQSMAALPAEATEYTTLIERLKRALDPNDVVAPGRYDSRARWQRP